MWHSTTWQHTKKLRIRPLRYILLRTAADFPLITAGLYQLGPASETRSLSCRSKPGHTWNPCLHRHFSNLESHACIPWGYCMDNYDTHAFSPVFGSGSGWSHDRVESTCEDSHPASDLYHLTPRHPSGPPQRWPVCASAPWRTQSYSSHKDTEFMAPRLPQHMSRLCSGNRCAL